MTNIYLDLLTTVNEGVTVITPNRRLSATLHKLYQAYRLEQNDTQWQTPDILPAASWLQRCWEHYATQTFSTLPLLLNNAQEQFLWESILQQDTHTQFLQISETAELARTAWNLLKQWNVGINDSVFKATEDYHAFYNWAKAFEAHCLKENYLPIATLPNQVIDKILDKEIVISKTIILVGFNELSPQLTSLLSACQTVGSKTVVFSLPKGETSCHRVSLLDQEEEILTIAKWAKSIASKQPDATIGCVIPSLDKIRDRVAQIFSEVFASEHTYAVSKQAALFNISAGKSLLHYPIINTAFQLLGLYKKHIPSEVLSYLLTSPYLGKGEEERLKRASYDSQLRKANIHQLNLRVNLIDESQKLSLKKYCPQLAKHLTDFYELYNKCDGTKSYREWADIFNQLLTACGWPGERSLESEEFQVVDNWLKLLVDFSAIDHVAQPVKFYEALRTLYKMAESVVFQPKTPDAPIQVLGMLEAAALPFDYLWISGLDDISWPPQPKPNPFIPKRLQRELKMPHATAERELTYCAELTEQFKRSASTVVFSHAEKNDELELQTSALIKDIAKISTNELNLLTHQTVSRKIYASQRIDYFQDEVGPTLLSTDKIRGGVNVLKQQASCPFRAFAEWRLHAQPLESPLPGLRAKDRGTILHKALEIFWKQLTAHEQLVSLSDSELEDKIHASIHSALTTTHHSRHDSVQYLALEKQRLYKLIWDWLAIEKQRNSFKVVMNEKESQITLNNLTLSIKIDRIDELESGKKLIIDYKTGKNNEISDWLSDRPEEPQLPLYALLDKDNTSGITFAQVAPGEHCFKGISQYALDIKGIKQVSEIKKITVESWDEQLNQWHTILTKLSDDFYKGIASVDPKEAEQTCTWCTLKPLCRIHETIHAET